MVPHLYVVRDSTGFAPEIDARQNATIKCEGHVLTTWQSRPKEGASKKTVRNETLAQECEEEVAEKRENRGTIYCT